jgi:single-stranded-DNA-specific exonuclease
LIERSKLGDNDRENLINRILDLVAIGTVADCVELRGENRVLVAAGLKVLNDTRRTGLLAMFKSAAIGNSSPLDTWNIGFQIAPRLNAAGRLGSANTAYELLVTRDESEAAELAARLNERNQERQRQSDEIFAAVVAQADPASPDRIVIGLCPDNQGGDIDDWNEGVVGLVAGKVVGKFYLPALVITKSPDGYKGSGRSVPEFNLAAAVEECAGLLTKYGGHPMACGFSLLPGNLDKFIARMRAIANERLGAADLRPKIMVDAEVPLSAIDTGFVEKVQALAPFGAGNERPNFLSRGAIVADILNMGMIGQHLKLRLQGEGGRLVTAIGFGQSEAWSHLKVGDAIDIVYYIELNTFNGRTEPQLKIVDIKTHNA